MPADIHITNPREFMELAVETMRSSNSESRADKRGLGFKTIRTLPTKHGLPLPTVTYDEPYLTFAFSRAYCLGISDERLSKLSNAEAKGLDYFRLNSPITRKAYEESLGLTTKTTERNLALFVELGFVKRVGPGPKTYYEIMK